MATSVITSLTEKDLMVSSGNAASGSPTLSTHAAQNLHVKQAEIAGYAQPRSLLYHMKTLWLFSRSDLKTFLIPTSTFALGVAFSPANLIGNGLDDSGSNKTEIALRVPLMIAIAWMNLLVADLSNQRLPISTIEDEINKPWRPLPSKRITHTEARDWLKMVIVSTLLLAYYLGCYTASASMAVMCWVYNDLAGSMGVWQRNALNAAAYTFCSCGALMTLLGGELPAKAFYWTVITGAIVMTTIHTQDLPDMEGDKACNKITIPLLWGDVAARISLAIAIPFWSAVCLIFWGATLLGWAVTFGTGATLAIMVLQQRGQEWDEMCWKTWCAWIVVIYTLPVFGLCA